MASAPPVNLNRFRYAYIVNPAMQEGQLWPLFTPLIREPDNTWPRVAGQAVESCYLYYTNTIVDEDDPHGMEEHVKSLRKGGPHVRKPDADDSRLMAFIKDRGFTPDAMERAVMASQELQAVMAVDGHFKVDMI